MNVLRDQCQFFTIPKEFVEAGHLRDLAPSALRLYMCLLYLAQKHSAVRIELANYTIADFTDLDSNSVKSARDSLEAAGLIHCQKTQHGIVEYELMNPERKIPLPAPKGRRGLKQHRPQSGRSARSIRTLKSIRPQPKQSGSESYPPMWDEIAPDPGEEPGEDGALSENIRSTFGNFPKDMRKTSERDFRQVFEEARVRSSH